MIQVSIIIPVWNGAETIVGCLDAIYSAVDQTRCEVICVDNASLDNSAELIATRFPQVRLIRQVINLGFAGGVNAGIAMAGGEAFFLLNQDCLLEKGWFEQLMRALDAQPDNGIIGCTILNADGTVNHAGAWIVFPTAQGIHLTDASSRSFDYVTGAAMVIRRKAWQTIGEFDAGFYPAYYEDADYCLRARRKGIGLACIPTVRVTHLFSNHEWQREPLKTWANQHVMRYRFVAKHFGALELVEFFAAERQAIAQETYFDQIVTRWIAARDILRNASDLRQRCQFDFGELVADERYRQWQVGWTSVLRDAVVRLRHEIALVPLEMPIKSSLEAQRDLLEHRERLLLAQWSAMVAAENDRAVPRWQRWTSRMRRVLDGSGQRLLGELLTAQLACTSCAEQVYQERHAEITRRITLLELLLNHDYR